MPQLAQLSYVVWSQFLWLAIGLGFIFFVIARGMVPKIQATVDAREKQIASDLEQAQAARSAAEDTETAWRSRMDAARSEAARVADEAKQASARDAEARVHAASKKIDARTEAAQASLREAVNAARSEIEAVAAEAASEMVSRLTGLKVDVKEAAQAVKAEFHV